MVLFKTDEEKRIEEERKLKEEEKHIWEKKRFNGKVGQIHQGLSSFGLWGVRDNGKAKFKPTKFEIYNDKILIERNKQIIQLSQIKEIFEDESLPYEVIIILTNDNGIPIRGKNNVQTGQRELKAFVNVLTKLIEDNKSNSDNVEANVNSEGNPEGKIDKLIKLGEMHNQGLLSDEEFISLKQELLSSNNEKCVSMSENHIETSEKDIETSENNCENCGACIFPDDFL
ncbi:MAG: hypothetical protein ACLTWT_08135 [Methanobrevibacter smithii]